MKNPMFVKNAVLDVLAVYSTPLEYDQRPYWYGLPAAKDDMQQQKGTATSLKCCWPECKPNSLGPGLLCCECPEALSTGISPVKGILRICSILTFTSLT